MSKPGLASLAEKEPVIVRLAHASNQIREELEKIKEEQAEAIELPADQVKENNRSEMGFV